MPSIYSFIVLIMASHTSGIHCDIVCLEILSLYCRERYESPLARNLKVHVSLPQIGIAFRSRAYNFLVILGVIILRISSNVELDIRKKFQKPAPERYSKLSRFWSSSIRSLMKSVALYFFQPRRTLGRTKNRWRHLFMSRATFIALTITIKAAEASRTSSLSHFLQITEEKVMG